MGKMPTGQAPARAYSFAFNDRPALNEYSTNGHALSGLPGRFGDIPRLRLRRAERGLSRTCSGRKSRRRFPGTGRYFQRRRRTRRRR